MNRLKITGSRWAGFTGHLGTVDFVDGVSVDPVPVRISDRLAAAMPMVLLDDDGKELGDAGVVPRLQRESAIRQAEPRAALARQTEAERKSEELQEALKASKSPSEDFYTVEQLQAVADEKGIKGLRLVAEPWNVKGKAIPALIAAIMEAQNKFLEKQSGTVKAIVGESTGETEVVEEGETPTVVTIQADEIADAAITGDMSAAITAGVQAQSGETLLGSSVLASSYQIDGRTVTLGDLVFSAHNLSGASVQEWNELPDADREDLIRAELDRRLPKE